MEVLGLQSASGVFDRSIGQFFPQCSTHELRHARHCYKKAQRVLECLRCFFEKVILSSVLSLRVIWAVS